MLVFQDTGSPTRPPRVPGGGGVGETLESAIGVPSLALQHDLPLHQFLFDLPLSQEGLHHAARDDIGGFGRVPPAME